MPAPAHAAQHATRNRAVGTTLYATRAPHRHQTDHQRDQKHRVLAQLTLRWGKGGDCTVL